MGDRVMGSELPKFVGASPDTPSVPGTPATPGTPGAPESNGSGVIVNQSMVGLPKDPKTREEMLRERYLKGLKKRKCVVCGNTARAKCPFRACKTCCSKAQNSCTVHVLKPDKGAPDGTIVHPSFNVPPSSHSDQQWQMSPGSGYMRPGYSVPAPYNTPTPILMGANGPFTLDATAVANKYMPPAVRLRATARNPAMDHQELQRLKNLRAAAQRDVVMTNMWRLQRMKEYAAGEIAAENEAFDRYVLNSSLLAEVFKMNAVGLRGTDADDEVLLKNFHASVEGAAVQNVVEDPLSQAITTKHVADTERKQLGIHQIKQLIDSSFSNLRNMDRVQELNAEEETLQAGISGAGVTEKQWGPKRFKALTEDGKQVFKTVEAFDKLMHKLTLINSPEDIQACVDMYKESLGGNLHYLIPNLAPREESDGCSSTGKNFDNSLASPQANLSSAHVEANVQGQAVIDNCKQSLPMDRTTPLPKHKERAWESGVEKLEALHWHRKYLRGTGWWKVYAHEETIHRMCLERANAQTVILEL